MPLRRPLPLRPGNRVVVVAPSSAPRDPARYRAGLDRLRALGYDVRADYDPGARHGYLAAPDDARAAALQRALADPVARAIVCVRGGYGALRLLDRLDYAALARVPPKLVVGYSDTTALHAALGARLGWPGLSGPVVTEWAVLDDATAEAFRAVAEGRAAGTPLALPPGVSPGREERREEARLRPLVADAAPRVAEGVIMGGNLSVFSRLLGTPYLPNLGGALLVLEDVAEPPYRLDRMLTHLRLAGALDGLAGVVLGRFTQAEASGPTLAPEAVFANAFAGRPYPVATGLAYGHVLPRLTLPLGVRARLETDADAAHLTLLEEAVEAEVEGAEDA